MFGRTIASFTYDSGPAEKADESSTTFVPGPTASAEQSPSFTDDRYAPWEDRGFGFR